MTAIVFALPIGEEELSNEELASPAGGAGFLLADVSTTWNDPAMKAPNSKIRAWRFGLNSVLFSAAGPTWQCHELERRCFHTCAQDDALGRLNADTLTRFEESLVHSPLAHDLRADTLAYVMIVNGFPFGSHSHHVDCGVTIANSTRATQYVLPQPYGLGYAALENFDALAWDLWVVNEEQGGGAAIPRLLFQLAKHRDISDVFVCVTFDGHGQLSKPQVLTAVCPFALARESTSKPANFDDWARTALSSIDEKADVANSITPAHLNLNAQDVEALRLSRLANLTGDNFRRVLGA